VNSLIEEQSKISKNKNIIFILIGVVVIFFIVDIMFFQNEDYFEVKEKRAEILRDLDKDEPIKVGVVWPFFLEKGNNYFKEGVLIAVDELNKKKVLNREIEVVFRDDKWDVNRAQSIAKEFSNDPHIVAVIAHDNVDVAVPASIIYEYSGIVVISPAVSNPSFTHFNFDYIFRNTPSDVVIGEKLAKVAKLMNFRKMVVLHSDNSYSQALAKIFTEKAVQLGINITDIEKFTDEDQNFIKILSNISPKVNNNVDYDAIFVAGYEENVPTLIKQARELDIYAPFITGDALDSPALFSIGKDAQGTIVATIFNLELLNEKAQDFIETFENIYHIVPDTWAAQGYDAMMLLAKAIENAGTLEPKKISTQLKYMQNVDSIFGSYSLNTKGDAVGRNVYVKVVEDGKFKYLNIN